MSRVQQENPLSEDLTATLERMTKKEDEKKLRSIKNGESAQRSSMKRETVEFLNPPPPVDLSELNTGENPMEIFFRGSRVSIAPEVEEDLTSEIKPPQQKTRAEIELQPAAVGVARKRGKDVRAAREDKIEKAAEPPKAKPHAETHEVGTPLKVDKTEPAATPVDLGTHAQTDEIRRPAVTARVETEPQPTPVETPRKPGSAQSQPRIRIMDSFIFVPLWYFLLGLLISGLLGALIVFLSVRQ